MEHGSKHWKQSVTTTLTCVGKRKHEFNVDADWDVLGGRLGGTVDYYIRRTKDALWDYEVPVPPYMYPTMLANASEMENKGLEILIRATPIQDRKIHLEYQCVLFY